MNVTINENISVDVTFLPKKSKTDNTKYCINLSFSINEKGLRQFAAPITISTGISVPVTDFERGEMKGRSDKAKLVNETLNGFLTLAKNMLNELTLKKIQTAGELKQEIQANAKLVILKKAPRGQKQAFISRLKEYSFENVMQLLFKEKKQSPERQRNYNRMLDLLKEYFKNNIPTIDLISKKNLLGFKRWHTDEYLDTERHKHNTATTYYKMIIAVFNYAIEKEMITVSPIPPKFGGSFVDGDWNILSEIEMLKIMSLDDDTLSIAEQTVKYSLLVQRLTGIGYGDLLSLTKEHVKFNEDYNKYYIQKDRNKTGVVFTIHLSPNAKYAIDKLHELAAGESTYFNLPTIEYIDRKYKLIAEKAEIKTNVSTYSLRHTFAVDFMEKDGSLEDLKIILGHKEIKTTAIYGKVSVKRQITKMEHLENQSIIHQLQPQNKLMIAV